MALNAFTSLLDHPHHPSPEFSTHLAPIAVVLSLPLFRAPGHHHSPFSKDVMTLGKRTQSQPRKCDVVRGQV